MFLSRSGENMTYISCDLRINEEIENLFKAIEKERPDGVDIFINAAGRESKENKGKRRHLTRDKYFMHLYFIFFPHY